MTASDADHGTDHYDAPGICWRCGGPCLMHAGSVHGWTCRACLDRYLDEAATRWAARPEKAKERIERNLLYSNRTQTPVTANGQRREGGPRYVPRSPGADQADRTEDHHHQEGQPE
ncbi:MAG: hypothetical protein ACRDTK_02700 [Mycobacterium sp.]